MSMPSTSTMATLADFSPGCTAICFNSDVSETGVMRKLPVPQPATNNKRQQLMIGRMFKFPSGKMQILEYRIDTGSLR
jgi:hypothetical protein